MDKPPRNPAWNRDELTLALDLYVKTGGNPTAKDGLALEARSSVLNKMRELNGVGGSDTLRNQNGLYPKGMNSRRFDPAYQIQGAVGMQRGNRLKSVLWEEYNGRSTELAADAERIR